MPNPRQSQRPQKCIERARGVAERPRLTTLTDAAHADAVSTMVGQIAATRIDFRSNKFLNDHWGRESVAYVAEIDGFAVPVRFEVVIGVKKFVGPQFTIIEVVGDRLTDRRYVLDVRMQDGKVSAGLFDQWLVNSPDVTDPDVIRFLKRIVEKGREATRRDFTLAAA